jgi:hypothetical protein
MLSTTVLSATWPPTDSSALAHPDGAGPEDAPQFSAARQVHPIPRSQREVFGFARQIAARVVACRCRLGRGGSRWWLRARKPVIGVGPRRSLARVKPGLGYLIG